MFTPIYLLPQYSERETKVYQDRWWEAADGIQQRERVLGLIRNGAGEDFLQAAVEAGQLSMLEGQWDLRGLWLQGEAFDFPDHDTFEGIDFSYCQMYHSLFHNGVFASSQCSFGQFYGCEFKSCSFVAALFFATRFENCMFQDCDFVERPEFVNCELHQVTFVNCFFLRNVFTNCAASETTRIDAERLPRSSVAPPEKEVPRYSLADMDLVGIYRGLREAYAAGGARTLEDRYFVKEMEAITKFATPRRDQPARYLLQSLTKYGTEPVRVLFATVGVVLIWAMIFALEVGPRDGLVLSTGAFFTFGAKADLLTNMPLHFTFLYVIEAFLGLALMALLITLFANRLFRSR